MSLTPEQRGELRALILDGFHVDKFGEWRLYTGEIVDALAPVIANWLAAEREAGAAEVIARVADYFALVERIHEVYRHVVMDTAEDRALHARHIETADRALSLARAALHPTTEEPS